MKPAECVLSPCWSEARVHELLDANRLATYRWTDRIFTWLMPVQFIAGILAALVISPRTWQGSHSSTHIHVWAAILMGGAISGVPVAMTIFARGSALTRHVVAIGQMSTSALLIHLTGGRIETHFHVFGSLAFLTFYRDWTVLATATVVVAFDHFLRGVYFPQSVFGVLTATHWRWLEHAGWVIFEDVILILSCRVGVREMRRLAERRAELEWTNAEIEGRIDARTRELSKSEGRARQVALSLEQANKELTAQQSELIRLNSALEEANVAALQASAAKSAFLANMSHEIRTPMTAILGFAEILRHHHDDPSDRLNAVNVIVRNGRHLLALINDILDLSKIEAGRMEMEQTECRMEHLLRDLEDLFSPLARDKGIGFVIEVNGCIPERITSDPIRLKQAVVNLVSNAIKFTSRGEVRVTASCDVPSQRLVFQVNDTGPGMTPEESNRLFKPFTQGDVTTTRRFGGTGLGLTITHSLAKLLGGNVEMRTVPGEGSTFVLRVATGRLDGVRMIESYRKHEPAESASKSVSGKIEVNGRVLLVEDGPDNQRLISFLLRSAGAQITIAANGEEGMRLALDERDRGSPFDVILMDMQMPVMDGYTATRKLREQDYDGPILALTAHAMTGERERCLSAGCDGYLSKPITRDVLLSEVAARIGSRSEHASRSIVATNAGQ